MIRRISGLRYTASTKTRSFVTTFVLAAAIATFGSATFPAGRFTLAAPDELATSGLLKFILPRFSFKANIGIDTVTGHVPLGVDASPALSEVWLIELPVDGIDLDYSPDVVLEHAFSRGDDASSVRYATVMRRDGAIEQVRKFVDWLHSEVGHRTIAAFRDDGVQVYFPAAQVSVEVAQVELPGNAAEGERLSLQHCGRCHVVNESNRMAGLGSTPSFRALRANDKWQERFESFFARNPHPSFTQIEGITEPFHVSRPPPIVPLELTLQDVEAILAYVSRIEPADLGAPVMTQ